MRIFIIMMLFLSSMAYANIPSDESIRRLMSLTQIQEKTTEIFVDYLMSLRHTNLMINIEETYPDITLSQYDELTLVIKNHGKNIAHDLKHHEQFKELLSQNLMAIFKEHYTQDEINAMIAFYETPVGQSIVSKQYTFYDKINNDDMSQILLSYYQSYLFTPKAQDHHDATQKAIERIIRK